MTLISIIQRTPKLPIGVISNNAASINAMFDVVMIFYDVTALWLTSG